MTFNFRQYTSNNPLLQEIDSLPSFNSGDYSNKQDKFDRMMYRAHEYIGNVSPIVKKTIESLREDGFSDEDIVNFLATDLSNLEENINERMISYPSDMQIDGKVYNVDLGFKSFRSVYDADSEQFIFQYPDQGGRKSISKYDNSIKSVELHNPIKSPFTDPGYMNRD